MSYSIWTSPNHPPRMRTATGPPSGPTTCSSRGDPSEGTASGSRNQPRSIRWKIAADPLLTAGLQDFSPSFASRRATG